MGLTSFIIFYLFVLEATTEICPGKQVFCNWDKEPSVQKFIFSEAQTDNELLYSYFYIFESWFSIAINTNCVKIEMENNILSPSPETFGNNTPTAENHE